MKSITINGSKRESVGKVATKALRNAGKVPCVLYGGDQAMHFSADELSFSKLVYTPNVYTASIELENGDKFKAILKDIQFHPVTDKILHVDFYELSEDREVTMDIPVRIIGNSPGVMLGGNLRNPYRTLRVRAIPSNLPDFINADISTLNIGDKLSVAELLALGDFTILHPENTIVAQVRVSRLAVSAEGEDEEDEEEGTEGAEGAEGGEAAAAAEGTPASE